MNSLVQFWREQYARLLGSLKRRGFESDLDEEIEGHLALLTQRFIERGMSVEEAGYQARRQFGGVSQMKSNVRDGGRLPFLEHVIQDCRYVGRQLRKSPVFVSTAVLTLALAIGANTAIFTLVDQLILQTLPIQDPGQVMKLSGEGSYVGASYGLQMMSYPMYQDLRDRNQVFSIMMCRLGTDFTLETDGQSRVVSGEFVSGNYFRLLGIGSALGRVITAADDLHASAQPVAVISRSYWRNAFGSDPEIVGRTIRLNNYPFTIIGVSRAGFNGLEPGLPANIFVPMALVPQMLPNTDFGKHMFDRRRRWVSVYGRLKEGVSRELAQGRLQNRFHQILAAELNEPAFRHATNSERKGFSKMWLRVSAGARGTSALRRQYERPLWLLAGVVGLVLLIACANLAGLLTARAAMRQKEIALRLAIGSSRRRLLQQLFTESTILAGAGGTVGVGVAVAMVRGLVAYLPQNSRGYAISSTPDWRMLAFSLVVSSTTGILFGFAPALQASRQDVTTALKDQATGVIGSPPVALRKLLVSSQLTLCLVLLAGASLLVKSLMNLQAINPGFNAQHLVQFDASVSGLGYGKERKHIFYRELEERLSRLAGVKSAGMAAAAVLSGDEWVMGVSASGHGIKPGEQSFMNAVSPGYFRTLDIRLLAGRPFRSSDTQETAKVAVVNQRFAKLYFGDGAKAVGQHIGIGNSSGPFDTEIVGVVDDTHYVSLRQAPPMEVFLPGRQMEEFAGTLYVRTTAAPQSLFGEIRKVVHDLEPRVPVVGMQTTEEQIEDSLASERMVATLSAGFGIVATGLALIGLYGVVAFMVGQRAREIAIRMALGAFRGRVIWLVMREVLLLVGAGVMAALPLIIGFSGLVSAELFGVTPTDPTTIASAAILLAVAGLTAGYLPARRAAGFDPMSVLRHE